MTTNDDVEGYILEDVGEDVSVHNTKDPEEVFITNKSRLHVVLSKYKDGVESLNSWVNPFILLVTVGSIVLVGDFQRTFGMSGDFWLAVYYLTGVLALAWLIVALLEYKNNRDKADIETVINELKRE